MLDRISLGRFLCLSGFLWLLYGLNGACYGVRLGLSVHSSCTVTTLSNLEMPYTQGRNQDFAKGGAELYTFQSKNSIAYWCICIIKRGTV